MTKRDELIILYDYYGELLSDDNRKYFEDYYFDNLSLGEIAENNSVIRNAVHKRIKTSEDKLLFYEEKLGIYAKDKKVSKLLKETGNEKLIEELKKI